MKSNDTSTYIKLVLIHLFIGLAVYFIPVISKLYAIAIILVGYRYVILRKNANNEALYMACLS